jgi:hypothetical protein
VTTSGTGDVVLGFAFPFCGAASTAKVNSAVVHTKEQIIFMGVLLGPLVAGTPVTGPDETLIFC